jgi:hypothetical protein
VTVEVRRADLKVRSRNGFSDLSRRTETALKAESVLLLGGTTDDRRLLVEIGPSKKHGGSFDVSVTLGVPVEALALTPHGKGFKAEIPLAVATEDKAGNRATLSSTSLQVLVATPPKAGTYARFQTVVRLSSLEQRLVFTIPDPLSGRILWNEAPADPGKGQ